MRKDYAPAKGAWASMQDYTLSDGDTYRRNARLTLRLVGEKKTIAGNSLPAVALVKEYSR